jgi:hypothetical protein
MVARSPTLPNWEKTLVHINGFFFFGVSFMFVTNFWYLATNKKEKKFIDSLFSKIEIHQHF